MTRFGWAVPIRRKPGGLGGTGRAMAFEGRGEPAHRGEGPPSRVVIEGVRPEIDAGQFPIKRTVGEEVVVSADIFAEGHDLLAAVVKHRAVGLGRLVRAPDGRRGSTTDGPASSASIPWAGTNTRSRPGSTASAPGFATSPRSRRPARTSPASCWKGPSWCSRPPAAPAGPRPTGSASAPSSSKAPATRPRGSGRRSTPSSPSRWPTTPTAAAAGRTTARWASWSSASGPATAPGTRCSPARPPPSPAATGRSRTSRRGSPMSPRWASTSSTCRPIHPIGRSFRKGPNNTLTAGPDDPGSPWAIGSERGRAQGHPPRPRHPRGLRPPRRRGPRAGHRDRARHRLPVLARPPLCPRASRSGSGTGRTAPIKYAENPPKKYQDIYPIDFECAATGRPSGTSCATSSCSGSTTASRSSASTTRTPSRSGSGTG